MKILTAKSAGFCFGVKRAMDMTLAAVKEFPDDLYTLGPLIHNPQVVQFLRQSGVKVKGRIESIPRGTVIFRSHGVSVKDLKEAKDKKLRIIDATCPIVKKAQFFAKFLHRHGYTLVLVGDAHHPEVEAIRSYVEGEVEIVENADALNGSGSFKKLGIIAQTTQSETLFREVVAVCSERAKELRAFNTICQATAVRQKEAVEIARKTDCMIVIGGNNSGNTERLATICKKIQPCTHHIETAEEIHPKWLAGKKRVGLTAGASTPSWIIDDVVRWIEGTV